MHLSIHLGPNLLFCASFPSGRHTTLFDLSCSTPTRRHPRAFFARGRRPTRSASVAGLGGGILLSPVLIEAVSLASQAQGSSSGTRPPKEETARRPSWCKTPTQNGRMGTKWSKTPTKMDHKNGHQMCPKKETQST